MIVALISLRRGGDRGAKRRGDVLAVRLADSPWGRDEQRFHLLVEWEDATLETELLERRAAGEPHPSATLPYARYQTVNTRGTTRRVMQDRSTQSVNVDALPTDQRQAAFDRTKRTATIPVGQYQRRTRR